MARRPVAVLLAVVAVVSGALSPTVARARTPSSGRLAEKDLNLDHARRVADLLRSRGVHAELTRTDDASVPLGERTAHATAVGADAFVSVHANASPDGAVRGSEVYAQVNRPDSVALARHVLERLTVSAGTKRRGVFQRAGRDGDYYAVLRTARMPAVLVEVAYLSNRDDARLLASEAFRRRAAEGMAAGITEWLAEREQASWPAVPPPERAAVPVLAAPGSPAASLSGRDVKVQWRPVPGATTYRVWRDGALVADVGPVSPSAPGGVEVVDRLVPGGQHTYEVRAVLRAGAQVLDESPSAATAVVVPWLVSVDAGHGGRDPGAVAPG